MRQDHEWVKIDGNVGTIGITNHAQDLLGDVVFVDLPEVGAEFEEGETMGAVESVKAASDIYSPITGARATHGLCACATCPPRRGGLSCNRDAMRPRRARPIARLSRLSHGAAPRAPRRLPPAEPQHMHSAASLDQPSRRRAAHCLAHPPTITRPRARASRTPASPPLAGKVVEVNEELNEDPSLVNKSAEADGWMTKMEITNPAELDELMDEATYETFCADAN